MVVKKLLTVYVLLFTKICLVLQTSYMLLRAPIIVK